MKTYKSLVLAVIVTTSLVASVNVSAGRYDGITEVFNNAVRNIQPPPPRNFDLDYNAQGFDPPGLRSPTIKAPEPTSHSFTPEPTLTDTFNSRN